MKMNPLIQYEQKWKKTTLFVSIIDDEEFIGLMVKRILKMMEVDLFEFDIAIFESGIQFFESRRLEELGAHFLILDGVMPEMDGIEILQKVKKVSEKKEITILMLSGRKKESDIEKALKLGANDYLTKPFSITDLQRRIYQLLNRMELVDES